MKDTGARYFVARFFSIFNNSKYKILAAKGYRINILICLMLLNF